MSGWYHKFQSPRRDQNPSLAPPCFASDPLALLRVVRSREILNPKFSQVIRSRHGNKLIRPPTRMTETRTQSTMSKKGYTVMIQRLISEVSKDVIAKGVEKFLNRFPSPRGSKFPAQRLQNCDYDRSRNDYQPSPVLHRFNRSIKRANSSQIDFQRCTEQKNCRCDEELQLSKEPVHSPPTGQTDHQTPA